MKAILCAKCMDIRALHPEGEWTTCRCGNTSARWLDPHRGTVKVRARQRSFVRILGVNNQFLVAGIQGVDHRVAQPGGRDEAWRKLHEEATDAPGYVFDKGHRGCWACIIRVGETNDVTWEGDPDEGS